MCPDCDQRVTRALRLLDSDRREHTLARVALEEKVQRLERTVNVLRERLTGSDPTVTWLTTVEAASVVGEGLSLFRYNWRKHHRDVRTVIRARTRYWHREDIEQWAATG